MGGRTLRLRRVIRNAQAANGGCTHASSPLSISGLQSAAGAIIVGAGNPIGCPCECYPHGLRRALFGGIGVDITQTWAELGAEDGATVSVEVRCGSL
jgi:hypothetical protein